MELSWALCQKEALDIAYKQNLDLLCVAPKARPAVCKVLDYGRYHFEQQKKAKEAKRKQHVVEVSLYAYHQSLIRMILKQNYVMRQNGSRQE